MIRSEFELYSPEVFGDSNEHTYTCYCYDGFAICKKDNEADTPDWVLLFYPKRNELDKHEKRQCLFYRGIYGQDSKHCNVSDIAMSFGEVHKIPKKVYGECRKLKCTMLQYYKNNKPC